MCRYGPNPEQRLCEKLSETQVEQRTAYEVSVSKIEA